LSIEEGFGLGFKLALNFSALQFDQLTLLVLPLIGVRQGGFSLGDAGPANLRQLCIQSGHVLLTLRHVFFCINGVDGALRNANRAVNALIRVDGQEVRAFTKTVNWTNIYTVGVFASDTGFGDNVGHDKSVVVVKSRPGAHQEEPQLGFFHFN
jgi:hypothetical protein